MTPEPSYAAPSSQPGAQPSSRRGALPRSIEPMLAALGGQPFDSPSHIFEVKWDGVRAFAFIEGGEVRIQDRYLRDVTALYPELQALGHQTEAGSVLDGEIVVLDGTGRPELARLRERLAARHGEEAKRLAASAPVTFQAFDILYSRGDSVMDRPLWRRKLLLHRATRSAGALAVPGFLEREGIAFFEAAREHGLEGVLAKEREGPYLSGRRSAAWLKLKVHQKEEFVVGGYTFGGGWRREGRPRQGPFESLLLGLFDEGGALRYVGEVAGGYAEADAGYIARSLDALASKECPFREEPASRRLVFWCRPGLVATVRFAEWTADGRLRFPVFEALRPDVPPASCRLDAARPAP
jgi:bifunctional non-homologous end joining protein LigD